MDARTYYRDHWVRIEPERLSAYEELLRWRPEMEPLLAPASVASGQVVVDWGCGPGFLACELARRVGETGRVHAIDLNEDFVRRTRERAAGEGLSERVVAHHVTDDRAPVEDASVDRVVCKNVLEYVPDVLATLRELRRCLRPGGRLHVIDSDWGMLVVEPLGPERTAELMAAAGLAFRTPLVGRRLYGLFREAGLRDVEVRVVTPSDVRGHMAPIVRNMASYARDSGRLDPAKIDAVERDLEAAIAEERYLLVLPQFLVTGTA